MEYCKRCVYPANARPMILFDEHGVCSGCRLIESRPEIDWAERQKWLGDLLAEYKAAQRAKGNPYDCVIPVSGGKDSHFQVHVAREVYGLNPLLVCYNHTFNTAVGLRNLANLIERFDCNLLRYTTAPGSARRIARHMLKKVGDITWHYHAGIMTFPIKAAVAHDVPLIIWGEEGFSELIGMHNQDDFVEFTKKKRREHSMRGFEPEDLLQEEGSPLTPYDLAPFFYPSDEDIERVGVRGIYLSNYFSWDAHAQSLLAVEKFGFETAQARERTFNTYAKIDDLHANGLHDYLKYLKFGYGRATDDASTEVRHGRMSREEAIAMVERYDHVRPSDMDVYLEAVGMTEAELLEMVDPLRDPSIWEKDASGVWCTRDSVANHVHDQGVEEARLPARAFTPVPVTPERQSRHCQPLNGQKSYILL